VLVNFESVYNIILNLKNNIILYLKMLWKEVLTDWENGKPLQYPKNVKGRFQWNTSVLKNNGNVPFKQTFRTNDKLPLIQNKKDFQEHITNSKNNFVVAFPNLSKDTMLVVPIPIHGKNYSTLRDFIENAPELQQKEFWKKVAEVAKNFMHEKDKVWISVHGMGVGYTHVRISTSPKYYFDKELAKD
jgi:hypothetical protein